MWASFAGHGDVRGQDNAGSQQKTMNGHFGWTPSVMRVSMNPPVCGCDSSNARARFESGKMCWNTEIWEPDMLWEVLSVRDVILEPKDRRPTCYPFPTVLDMPRSKCVLVSSSAFSCCCWSTTFSFHLGFLVKMAARVNRRWKANLSFEKSKSLVPNVLVTPLVTSSR